MYMMYGLIKKNPFIWFINWMSTKFIW
jgi:hypothetical protein